MQMANYLIPKRGKIIYKHMPWPGCFLKITYHFSEKSGKPGSPHTEKSTKPLIR
jgi:hypothetical protein